jgi:hypothetical protein
MPSNAPGNLRQEVHGDAHKLVGLFQVGSMPTLLDHHEVRSRDSLMIEGPTFHGDDLILLPSDDACGRRDPGEQPKWSAKLTRSVTAISMAGDPQ